MSEKHKVGDCSTCNSTHVLRANGTIPSHKDFATYVRCDGTGKKPRGKKPAEGKRPYTCSECEGEGRVVYTRYVFNSPTHAMKKCPTCKGTGKEMRR